MPRVRWADLGPADAAAVAAAAAADGDVEDAWGPDEEHSDAHEADAVEQPIRVVSQAQQASLAALLAAAHRQPQQREPVQRTKPLQQWRQQQAAPQKPPHHQQQFTMHQVPSLHKLCMTVLGQHVTVLVEQLGDQVQWLPAEVRAALLAVARRRGEVTALLLSSLADDSWHQLDLAGCSKLYAAQLLAVVARTPHLTALDVTGCARISAGGWRQLAQACPRLQVLKLGGSAECSEAAFKALPHILPSVPPPPHKAAAAVAPAAPAKHGSGSAGQTACAQAAAAAAAAAAVADSWEDAFASDNEDGSVSTSSQPNPRLPAGMDSSTSHSSSNGGGQPSTGKAQAAGTTSNSSSSSSTSGRLKHLQALIWPDVPTAAVELVQQRCPRVLVNPPLKPDKLTGQPPPREWHPEALDEPCMQMVLPAALHKASAEAITAMAAAGQRPQRQQPEEQVVHIADKFRQAYIDRAKRLKEKERRLAAAEERKQLRASHALRTLDAWLDERD